MSKHLALGAWQKLCNVYTAVTPTSKCPCQISPKPLIMSLFLNFTATCASILLCGDALFLRLLTGLWQFQNDFSHLPMVHWLKAWHLARCCLACQQKAARWPACICMLLFLSRLLSNQWDGAFINVGGEISASWPARIQSPIRSWKVFLGRPTLPSPNSFQLTRRKIGSSELFVFSCFRSPLW